MLIDHTLRKRISLHLMYINRFCPRVTMTLFKKSIFVALLGIAMASPVLAKGVLYDCKITQGDLKGGWVQKQIVVIVPESGQA